MNVFVVVLTDDDHEGLRERVAGLYPNAYWLEDGTVLVAADAIAEEVAMKGVVFKLNSSYSGYTRRSLWDWLREVEDSQ